MAADIMLGTLRYDSELGASPMHTASSASCNTTKKHISAKQHVVNLLATGDQQDLLSENNEFRCHLTWTCKQSVSAME